MHDMDVLTTFPCIVLGNRSSIIEKSVCILAPCSSRIVKFLIHDWFLHQTTNTKGKECCSVLSRHLWGGLLRDDTKNSCVAD